MKRLLPALCAVAGIAAGLAIGYALAPKAAPRLPTAEVAEQPVSERPEGQEKTAPQPVAQEQPSADAPDFGAVVAKHRPASVLSGGGEFTGRITLADGKPVAGVEVRCAPHVAPIPDGLTLEEEVEAFARNLALEESGARAARTGSDGSYRIVGLDEKSRYSVEPRANGYEFRRAPAGPVAFHKPGRELNFVARAVVWITADVRMPDGSQPEIARMSLTPPVQRPEFSRSWTWTPAERKYGVEPGEWWLRAWGGRWGEFPSERISFEVSADGPPLELKILLKDMPSLRGRVNVPAGLNPPGNTGRPSLAVKLERADGGEVSEKHGRAPHYRYNPYSLFLPNTEFTFVELRPGLHRLTVMMQGKAMATQEVEITSGMAWVDLDMPEPDASAYLVVRVTGPGGPVTDGVYFMLEYRKGGRRSSGSTEFLNKGNGEYWISRTVFKEEEGSEYTLTARSQKLGERSLKLEPQAAGPIEFTFVEPGFIVVEIAGYDAHAQKDELKVLHWPAGKEPDRYSAMEMRAMDREESGGSRRIGPLEPGEYVVVLSLGAFGIMGRKELDRQVVLVSAGDIKTRLVAPTLYSLTITLPEEYRANQLVVRYAGNHEYSFLSRSGEPEFVVSGLRPGDYHINGRGYGQMTVSVPAVGERVEFKPQPFNAFLVVSWGRRDAKDIGLKAGDLVILIDGQVLDDKPTRDKALSEGRKRETTWTVLRNGQRMNVTFNGAELNQTGLNPEGARWN